MTRPTHCADCAAPIKQPPSGRRLLCPECKAVHIAHRLRRFYAEHRQDSPDWRKLNAQRAKAWRKRNRQRIRKYNKYERPRGEGATA